MTDFNAPLDPTERDAMAWRMLTERLDMAGIDVDVLMRRACETAATKDAVILQAVHDAIAYRRQS